MTHLINNSVDIALPNSDKHLELTEAQQNVFSANNTLPHEGYIKYEDLIVEEARQSLNIVQDLMTANLVVSNGLDLGTTIAKYFKVKDMTEANVGNDFGPGQTDGLHFDQAGVPVPIIYKDFELNERQLLALAKDGVNTDANTGLPARLAMRTVFEKTESMVVDGLSVKLAGLDLQGLTNFSSRNTGTATAAWGGGGDDPVDDALQMVQDARNDNFRGPFIFYVSKDNYKILNSDFSANKGDDTFRDRILKIPEIIDVKICDELSDGELLLVQMTPDVVSLVVAQDPIIIAQPSQRQYVYNFTAMAAMSVICRADSEGRCGIVHYTGA